MKAKVGLDNKLFMHLLRILLSGWSKGTISEQRARQERSARFFRLPKQIRCQPVQINGMYSEWLTCPNSGTGTIVYLHGGAYALGSINSHREVVARLVLATKCDALVINYRLAPENPFPAALEDALKAYKWVLLGGVEPSRISLAGDSAGGGLAIATLLALRDEGIPLPAGAFCFSPWLDLTLSGGTIMENNRIDPILSQSILKKYVDYYTDGRRADDPLVSPLFANLRGLPPIFLQAGRNEVLLDDAARFQHKASLAGVDITLKIWDNMFHVFQLFDFLPQTKESIKLVRVFLDRVMDDQHSG